MTTVFSAIAGNQKIDAEKGVIHGVSVITKGEAKGHGLWVDDITLAQFSEHGSKSPEGVKVKLQHFQSGEDSPIVSIVGSLKNFRVEGDNTRADLHVLKSDSNYSKIFEIAEKMPSQLGLSVSFNRIEELIDGKKFVRVKSLDSVDLVSDPAANPTGLFSAAQRAVIHKLPPDQEALVDSPTLSKEQKTMFDEIKNLLKQAGEKLTAFATNPPAADVAALKTQLSELEGKISTELTQTKNDLATAKQTISTLETAKTDFSTKLTTEQGKVTQLSTALKAACVTLKIEDGDETKLSALSDTDKITALQNGVASTLAKLNIAPEKIPVAKPATGTTDSTTKTRTAFAAMKPAEQLAFSKSGGKITD